LNESEWDQGVEEELAAGWRELHDEELRDVCCSPNIIMVI
jgi:hypothetical protein